MVSTTTRRDFPKIAKFIDLIPDRDVANCVEHVLGAFASSNEGRPQEDEGRPQEDDVRAFARILFRGTFDDLAQYPLGVDAKHQILKGLLASDIAVQVHYDPQFGPKYIVRERL